MVAFIADRHGDLDPFGQGLEDVDELAGLDRGGGVLTGGGQRSRGLDLDFDVGGQEGHRLLAHEDVGQDRQGVTTLDDACDDEEGLEDGVPACLYELHF